MQRHAAKVSDSVLPSGIPLIRIDGRTLGTEESSHIIKIVCDMVQDIEQHVIIDLSAFRYLSSFALGSSAPLTKARNRHGLMLVIAGANEMRRDVIILSGLNESLRMCSSSAGAEKLLLDEESPPLRKK